VANTPTSDPAVRIPLFKVFMAPRDALMPRLEAVLYSGQIGEGTQVTEFESAFGAYIGNPNVLSFNSGTAALHGAVVLAGVKPGNEVITTPMTAEPSNMAILHAGGVVKWADVDALTGNLSATDLAEQITPRTKAILLVHYGGLPANIDAIRAVAARHHLPVIEDAAHALGARWRGQPLGQHSEFVMFSFQAIKHLTTVDGGMLAFNHATDMASLLAHGRRFRWFGIDRAQPRTEVDVSEVGYKHHMNNVNATIGQVQLAHIDPVIARHRENGRYLDQALQGIPGLATCKVEAHADPSWWLLTVLADNRDGLMRHLAAHGIASSQAHRRNDLHRLFAGSRRELPGLDAFYSRMLHLPCGWWVSDEDREFMVDVIKRGW
jgi:perosamine synthetase